MKLSSEGVERFFRVWIPLLHHVNVRLGLVPPFPATARADALGTNNAIVLRCALWQEGELLDDFVTENPAGLSSDDLRLVTSWKHRVEGTFFVFRYLKRHTVLLPDGGPGCAYGALGLGTSIEQMLGNALPIMVEAVLLPFEGKIVYDSLLNPYTISFGAGIRARLKDDYRDAQERGQLITSLDPSDPASSLDAMRERMRSGNTKILRAFRTAMAGSGLSDKMISRHSASVEAFASDFLLAADPPRPLLDIGVEDLEEYVLEAAPKVNLVSFRRFVRFLRDTGRAAWEEIEALQDFLKSQ